MTTWREGLERWRDWASKGGDINPDDAECICDFFEAVTSHCAQGGSFDEAVPAELAARMKERMSA